MDYYSRSLTRNRDNIWEVGFFENVSGSLFGSKYILSHERLCVLTCVARRCFAFITLRDQVDPQQLRPADWLVCQSTRKFVARQVVCLMKNGQQSQNLSLKVDPSSNFRNNFLQSATNAFVARQVYHSWWKTGNIDEKLQRQAEGFLIPYFAALSENLWYVWLK